MHPPSNGHYLSFLAHLSNDNDLCDEEEQYYLYPDQMIALEKDKESSWLESFIGRILMRVPYSDALLLIAVSL